MSKKIISILVPIHCMIFLLNFFYVFAPQRMCLLTQTTTIFHVTMYFSSYERMYNFMKNNFKYIGIQPYLNINIKFLITIFCILYYVLANTLDMYQKNIYVRPFIPVLNNILPMNKLFYNIRIVSFCPPFSHFFCKHEIKIVSKRSRFLHRYTTQFQYKIFQTCVKDQQLKAN